MSYLGLDIGSSSCKAALYAEDGAEIAGAARAYATIRDRPGQAELDSRLVWNNICEVIRECAASAQSDPVRALAVASLGEAFVPLDRAGNIAGNSPLGTDTRGLHLDAGLPREEIAAITRQPPGAGYALWNLLQPAYARTHKFLFWADFVTWRLTGNMACNTSLAARTLLYDLENECWSERIASAAGFDLDKLPPPVKPGSPAGRILPRAARELGLPADLAVVHGTHDQCAAALGAGALDPGSAMLGLGTYACLVMVHDSMEYRGLNIEPHAVPGNLVSFLYHGSSGSLLLYFRNLFFAGLPEQEAIRRMEEEMAAAPSPSGVTLLPYFAETGPPDFAAGGRGVIAGLSLQTPRGSIFRTVPEAGAFYFRAGLDGNPDRPKRLLLTGGGARSGVFRQILGDVLEIPVARSGAREAGTLGCAMLAAGGDLRENAERMLPLPEEYNPPPGSFADYRDSFERYLELKEKMKYIPL